MPSNPDIEVVQVELRRAIMTACCNALHAARLSPTLRLMQAADQA